MSSTRSGPLSRPARRRAKPTPKRLATLAPTSSTAAVPRVSSSRMASCAVWAASARRMIGQMQIRKASAAASQPPTTAIPQGRNHTRTTTTISPMEPTRTARRIAGAYQPSHRWYRVGGGLAVIVGVLPIPSRPATTAAHSPMALRIELLAACSVPFGPVGDRAVFMAWMALVSSRIWLDRLSSCWFCRSSCSIARH
jgi:hypothetical protein